MKTLDITVLRLRQTNKTTTFKSDIIMSYLTLPKRVFNSPLIKSVNYADGSHINMIKLIKPYANGNAWAIHETTAFKTIS